MPEKDGAEEKSTKSVVNKKQKLGEEGYDIARDMGRVRPSKDKKDATTMTPSKEMRKTQKVNKGPSAFARVKAKYGKSVMNVGKKKVQDEFDLTQVAEAFGGYIVEKKIGTVRPGEEEATKNLIRKQAEQPNLSPAGQKRLKKISKSTKITDANFERLKKRVSGEISADADDLNTVANRTKSGSQSRFVSPEDRPTGEVSKPKTTRANYPKTRAELETKRKEYEIDRQGKTTDAGVEKYARRTKQSNLPLSQDELDTARKRMVGTGEKGTDVGKYGGRLGRKRNKNMPSLDQVKADIDAKEKAKAERKSFKAFTKQLQTPTALPAQGQTSAPKPEVKITDTTKPESKPNVRTSAMPSGTVGLGKDDNVNVQTDLLGNPVPPKPEKKPQTDAQKAGRVKAAETRQKNKAAAREKAFRDSGQTSLFDRENLPALAALPDNVRVGTTSGDLIQDRPVMRKGEVMREPSGIVKTRPTEITPTGRVKPIGTLGRRAEKAQQQSALGALGGFLAKSAVPATAGLEAAERLRRGEKGVALSAIQAMDIPVLSKAAGIMNAIQTVRRGQQAAANQQAMVDAATGGGGGGGKKPPATSGGKRKDDGGGGGGLAAVGGDGAETDTVTSRILATQLPNIGKRLRQGAGSVPRGLRGGTVGRRSAGGFTAT